MLHTKEFLLYGRALEQERVERVEYYPYTVSRGLPRVIWLLSVRDHVRVQLLGNTKRPVLTGCLFAMLKP
jgi:predicted lipoprotein